jgi:hypothetical protein
MNSKNTEGSENLSGFAEDKGLFLSMEECKCLFRRFKNEENNLVDEERGILRRLEKLFYSRLSIKEIEDL